MSDLENKYEKACAAYDAQIKHCLRQIEEANDGSPDHIAWLCALRVMQMVRNTFEKVE